MRISVILHSHFIGWGKSIHVGIDYPKKTDVL
jgi:hypothetical protein